MSRVPGRARDEQDMAPLPDRLAVQLRRPWTVTAPLVIPHGGVRMSLVLAHGGTAGLLLELALLVALVAVPIAALVPLARWLRRQDQPETDQNGAEVKRND